MQYYRTLALAVSSLVIVSFTTFSGPAVADDNGKFDIAGIRLGMTPEQAVQALKAQGISGDKIYESRMAYGYSDGVNHGLKTDDFLARITAAKVEILGSKRRSDSFEVCGAHSSTASTRSPVASSARPWSTSTARRLPPRRASSTGDTAVAT
jgi:hypothetical protein